jgi:hypothetical protein
MAIKSARKQIRYHRNDIDAVFKKKPAFLNRLQPVKILNISKQGIAICSNQVLKRNSRLEIKLCFRQGQSFLLNGQVVHSFTGLSDGQHAEFVELFQSDPLIPLPFKYGIHFDRHYLPFSDYLIESGCIDGFEVQPQGYYQRQVL